MPDERHLTDEEKDINRRLDALERTFARHEQRTQEHEDDEFERLFPPARAAQASADASVDAEFAHLFPPAMQHGGLSADEFDALFPGRRRGRDDR